MQTLWVQADPEAVAVSVSTPEGQSYSGASVDQRAPVVIRFADAKSNSSDEVFLAALLDGKATLVTWSETAPAGRYTIRFTGARLPAGTQVTVRKTTGELLDKGLASKAQQKNDEFTSTFFAAPEQTAPVDGQGSAQLTFQGAWEKDDALIIGGALDVPWSASVRFPDGTLATEATTTKAGCEWRVTTEATALKVPGKQLFVTCPAHMLGGSITVILQTDDRTPSMRLVAAILRPRTMEAALANRIAQYVEPSPSVVLFHKADNPDDAGFLEAIVDRPVAIRLSLGRAPSPVVAANVVGAAHKVAPNGQEPIPDLFDDPIKKYGALPGITRQPDGDFLCTFTPHEPGTHQLNFIAEGAFQDGRRFSADTGVRLFVSRKAATLTGVRQQRANGSVRFLVDLDVLEPGRYEANIQIGTEPNQKDHAYAEAVLTVGRQTMPLQGSRGFLARLAQNPEARLELTVINREIKTGDEFPGKVVFDAVVPTAGEFR